MSINPNSLKNLRPRVPKYEKTKTKKQITITELGWKKLKALSRELGYGSRSSLIEALARDELNVSRKG